MFRIYFPGQKLPQWLATVEQYNPINPGKVGFGNLCLIWRNSEGYRAVAILPRLPLLRVKGHVKFTIPGKGLYFHGYLIDIALRKLLK